jgi:protein SCO1/2
VNNYTSRLCRSLVAVVLLVVAGLSSCHRSAPAAKRYSFSGRIVSIDTQNQSAIVDGDAIPGFMEAMAMPYTFKPATPLKELSPGDAIVADVVVVPAKNDDSVPDYWLENVKIIGHSGGAPAAAANAMHMPSPGEEVPDFAFTNQSGKVISLKQYRGKVVAITFVYTRCPFPEFCPRMSGNFAEIYKQLTSDPALANTQLLTVSFDPEHDTPRILRDYGFSVAHTQDPAIFSRWQFAVPKTADLPKIADFFALTIKPEAGMITHNLSTTVIGRDGKIVKWYHGGDWRPSDLIKDVSGLQPAKS